MKNSRRMRSVSIFNQVSMVFFIIYLSSGRCKGGDYDIEIAPMKKTEQDALFSAIQSFVGQWWNGSDLYPDPCGWTPIQGVSCDLYDGFWYITSLNIGPVHENSLSCSPNVDFNPHLFKLKHLKALSFFSCFTSRRRPVSIPSEIFKDLQSLESLEFRSNPGLVGQIPTSFGCFPKLQSLVIMENGLNGELPSNLGKLTRLKRLVLSGNSFTGQIPGSLGGLKDLLILDFSRNALYGSLPCTIGNLASLIKLDLSNNLLNGTLPSEIGKMKSLTLLDVRNNKLWGGLINTIQDLGSLEELVLSNNPIGGDLENLEWQNMGSLVILDLSNTGLHGSIPHSISELRKLRFLGLSKNNLSGNLSPKLAKMPSITAMYLHGNNLTGELNFSGEFYGKMESRFSAWDNPNLCYPIEKPVPTNHVPLGVKPCQQPVGLSGQSFRKKLVNENLNEFVRVTNHSNIGSFCRCNLVQMMSLLVVCLLL